MTILFKRRLLVSLVFCAGSATAIDANQPVSPEDHPHAEAADAQALELRRWPENVGAVYGFEWRQADHPLLEDFKVQADTVFARGAYWRSGTEYGAFVTRRIELVAADQSAILTLTCCPNYHAARGDVFRAHGGGTGVRLDLGYGPTFDLAIGDVTVLLDVPTTPGARERFEGASSRKLLVIRGNLVSKVETSTGGQETVSAAALARSIDSAILKQHRECEGKPARPVVTVSLDNSEFDLRKLPDDQRSLSGTVSVTAVMPDGTPTRKIAFVAHQTVPFLVDEDGNETPDPDRKPYYRTLPGKSGEMMNDTSNPTTLTVSLSEDAGEWHIGAIAWGSNLLPGAGVSAFTVTTAKQ